MPRNYVDRRRVAGDKYEFGKSLAKDISSITNLLTRIVIRVQGKVTLSNATAANKLAPGGVYNLLKKVYFRFSGYDPSVGQFFSNQLRINLSGKYFGYGGNPAEPTPTDQTDLVGHNAYPRISVLQPHSPRVPGAHFLDIDPTINTEQDFYAEFEIPFAVPNGIAPADWWLDCNNQNLLEIEMETADSINDICTLSAVTAALSDASISINAEIMMPLDTPTARGGAHISHGYYRVVEERIAIDQDNTDLRRPFTGSDNLLAMYLFGTRPIPTAGHAGSVPDDTILRGISLEEQSDPFYVMNDANQWRSENQRNLGITPVLISGGQERTLLTGSGLYIAAPAFEDANNRVKLSKTVYIGRSDKSTQYALNVKRPAANINGSVDIVTLEYVPDGEMAVLSRPQRLLTATRRAAAQTIDAERNNLAMAQEDGARNAGAR